MPVSRQTWAHQYSATRPMSTSAHQQRPTKIRPHGATDDPSHKDIVSFELGPQSRICGKFKLLDKNSARFTRLLNPRTERDRSSHTRPASGQPPAPRTSRTRSHTHNVHTACQYTNLPSVVRVLRPSSPSPRPPLGIAGIPGVRPLLARAGQSRRGIPRAKRVPFKPIS